MLPDQYPNGRICNSDDDTSNFADSPWCHAATFDYPEIRISNGNWESSIFLSWIIQIILMEVLGVPVTTGLTPNVTLASSFYDPQNRLTYSDIGYPFIALQKANEVGSCLLTTDNCADVMPEVWSGQTEEWTLGLQEGYLDPAEGDGQVGKGSWFLPAFTADRDDSLVSFYGLRGEKNRQKLAAAFLRPTTWQDYCDQVSTTNCTKPDGTAERYPESDTELVSYFVQGLYTGHFRATEKNNCTLHPTTCTGAIIGPSCDWSTNIEAQIYWNNISLEPDGPIEPNGAYDYNSMIEIWRAANATQSNVILWWWAPDALGTEFQGTPGELQPILLPTATDECARNRVNAVQRCSANRTVRLGSPKGACDWEPNALQKIFARSLRELTYAVDLAHRSPGYDYINAFKVTDLQVNNMLRTWVYQDVDRYGNGARVTVCNWVVDNLDYLLQFIPQGYPRELSHRSSYQVWFLYLALAIAAASSFVIFGATATSFYYRKTKVFVFAQFYFVLLILLGSLMVSVGGIVTALEPSLATCTAEMWLVVLGYTVELVPVLVKTAAINKVLQSAKKMKRVRISPASMIVKVAIVVLLVVAYLLVWTILDPSDSMEVRVLAGNDPQSSTSHIVESTLRCSSRSVYWYYLSLLWQALLLLMATVLAFQSRNVMQEFNESQSLGTMVYCHFLFMVLRAVLAFMAESNTLQPNVAAALLSYDYSLDSLISTLIYLIPKFMQAKWSPEAYTRRSSVVNSRALSDIENKAAAARESYYSAQGFPYSPSSEFQPPNRSQQYQSDSNVILDDDSGMYGQGHQLPGATSSTFSSTSSDPQRRRRRSAPPRFLTTEDFPRSVSKIGDVHVGPTNKNVTTTPSHKVSAATLTSLESAMATAIRSGADHDVTSDMVEDGIHPVSTMQPPLSEQSSIIRMNADSLTGDGVENGFDHPTSNRSATKAMNGSIIHSERLSEESEDRCQDQEQFVGSGTPPREVEARAKKRAIETFLRNRTSSIDKDDEVIFDVDDESEEEIPQISKHNGAV